ncbi:lipoprotein LpqH [Nocardioides sp. LHD-245]|uniref:lipoprotein LpqH n=1 Tax=Nocardioides sp. LHD-245 TaxID=3051387 RepID=UPI0027E21548|nr:lipoprotein LpqH [Nocardioides sp. LHD-245]
MKLKNLLTAGIAVLALAGTMTACSEDEGDTTTDSTSQGSTEDSGSKDDAPVDEADEGDAAVDEGDTSVSSGGDTSVKVEGKDLEGLDLSTVTCVRQGGKITIASGAAGGQQGLGIVLTDEDTPKVEAFSMVVDGTALAVSSMGGMEVGSAEVSVDGDTYTLTGEAAGADMTDPTGEMITKAFEITISCT